MTYYNPYRDRQQDPPISHCSHCRDEIYGEDECYIVGVEIVCSNCLEDFEKKSRCSMTGNALDSYLHKQYGGLDDVD